MPKKITKKAPTLDHTHAVHQAVETLVHAISGLVGRVHEAVHEPAPARKPARKKQPAKRRSRPA